jgi:hypothetical protein
VPLWEITRLVRQRERKKRGGGDKYLWWCDNASENKANEETIVPFKASNSDLSRRFYIST